MGCKAGDNRRRVLLTDDGDTDAAFSLCALGRLTFNESPRQVERPVADYVKAYHPTSTGILVGKPNGFSILALLPKKKPQPQGAQQRKSRVDSTPISVPFEEKKRLMRVYGPIKTLRNRASKDIDQAAKPDSVRRKFYRWFPDFNERFVITPGGWYTPKAGHQQEMDYRQAMRKMDLELLVKKRNDRR